MLKVNWTASSLYFGEISEWNFARKDPDCRWRLK